MSDLLWQLGAMETAELISKKDVSTREVIENHLERLTEVNPKINAITRSLNDEAMEMAKLADEKISRNEQIGPLHGVPVTIKDNVDITGQSSPNGVSKLKDNLAPANSAVVDNLLKAGAIPIGRTNTPEFSLRWHTGNPLFGDTLNPWDKNITPGGSSGGAAASLAAGIGCIAHGNDLGGSLRYPAYCCGLATIKPTQGAIPAFNPTAGEDRPPMMQLLSTQGPITRSINDARLAFNAMSKSDRRDPWWTPSFIKKQEKTGYRKIALATETPGAPLADEVRQSLHNAGKILEAAGHIVEEISPPKIARCAEVWAGLIGAELRSVLREVMDELGSSQISAALDFLESFHEECTLSEYIRLGMERTQLMREWSIFLQDYEVIIGPVSNIRPFAPNEDIQTKERAKEIFSAHNLLVAVNLLGIPAATVCTGLQDDKPYGVQLIGWKYNEHLCLDLAQRIEDQVGTVTPIDPKLF